MGKRTGPPSAHDVARRIGMSQAAVSRAYTPGASVSVATREKVFLAAKELGYRPNLLARSLIKGRSDIIGVVVGHARNPFFTVALDHLSSRLRGAGKHLLVFTGESNATADVHVEDLLKYRVDALVLLWTGLSSALSERCRREGIPVVFLAGPPSDAEGFARVSGANAAGAGQIAAHLIAQGYRSFGFIAGNDYWVSREREQAFVAELSLRGFPPPEREVGNFDRESARQAMRLLLARQPRPEAIFCANDNMALAALEVARYEFGIEVGRELGIAGFDGMEEAAWPSFDLTTYTQPVRRMIEIITEILIEGSVTRMEEIVVPGELRIRASTRRSV